MDRFSILTEDFAFNYILPKYLSLYKWTKRYLGTYSDRELAKNLDFSLTYALVIFFSSVHKAVVTKSDKHRI